MQNAIIKQSLLMSMRARYIRNIFSEAFMLCYKTKYSRNLMNLMNLIYLCIYSIYGISTIFRRKLHILIMQATF